MDKEQLGTCEAPIAGHVGEHRGDMDCINWRPVAPEPQPASDAVVTADLVTRAWHESRACTIDEPSFIAALNAAIHSAVEHVRNDALEWAAQVSDAHWPESGHIHQDGAVSCPMTISVEIRRQKTLKEWQPTEHERQAVEHALERRDNTWRAEVEREHLAHLSLLERERRKARLEELKWAMQHRLETAALAERRATLEKEAGK